MSTSEHAKAIDAAHKRYIAAIGTAREAKAYRALVAVVRWGQWTGGTR